MEIIEASLSKAVEVVRVNVCNPASCWNWSFKMMLQ